MQIGDEVSVTEGPLVGLPGRITGWSERRVVLSVHLGGALADVEMDAGWIAPKAPIRKPASRDEREISIRSQQT